MLLNTTVVIELLAQKWWMIWLTGSNATAQQVLGTCVGGAPCSGCPQTSAKAFAAFCSCQHSTGLGGSLLTVTIFYVVSLGAVTALQSLLGIMSMIPLGKFSLGTSGYYLSSTPKMCLFWLPMKRKLVNWGWLMRKKLFWPVNIFSSEILPFQSWVLHQFVMGDRLVKD